LNSNIFYVEIIITSFVDRRCSMRRRNFTINFRLSLITQWTTAKFWRSMMMTITVISVNSKGGGKNGKHGHVEKVDSVTLISYAFLQVYDHLRAMQFVARPVDQTLEMSRFAHIPSSDFICTLQDVPSVVAGGLKLSAQDHATFQELRRDEKKIISVMKKRRSRRNQVSGS
jgi:hypothetical protein